MNLSFKFSPFAPRMLSSSEWSPVQHRWWQIRSYSEADFYPCLAVWVKASWQAHWSKWSKTYKALSATLAAKNLWTFAR